MAISPPSNRRIGSPSGVRSGASPPQALPPAGSGTSSACGAWRSRRRPRSKRICSSTPPITASKPPPSPSQKPGSAWPRAMPPPRTQKNSACCRRYGTLPRQRSMAHSAPSSSAQPSATSGNGRRTPRATSTAIQAISPRPSSNKRPSGLSDIRSSMIHPTFLAKAKGNQGSGQPPEPTRSSVLLILENTRAPRLSTFGLEFHTGVFSPPWRSRRSIVSI